MSKEIKNLSRSELIKNFVISNPDYYIDEFKKIGSKPSYSFSFNLFAALFGPMWFGLRNLWNYALAFEWLSNKSISPGMKTKNYFLSIGFTIIIMFFSVIHYSFPGFFSIMNDFPTHPEIRLTSIKWVETIFDYAVIKGDAVFTAITIGIRSVLDFLELLFVKTPWIVIITTGNSLRSI